MISVVEASRRCRIKFCYIFQSPFSNKYLFIYDTRTEPVQQFENEMEYIVKTSKYASSTEYTILKPAKSVQKRANTNKVEIKIISLKNNP